MLAAGWTDAWLADVIISGVPPFYAGKRHCRGKGEKAEGDHVHHGLARLGAACW